MAKTVPGLVIPDWILMWLLIIAVVSYVLGARRLAAGLVALPLFLWIVTPLKVAFIDGLPVWTQAVIGIAFVLLALQAILMFVFGKDVAAQVVGQLLTKVLCRIFVGPFILSRAIIRKFMRR